MCFNVPRPHFCLHIVNCCSAHYLFETLTQPATKACQDNSLDRNLSTWCWGTRDQHLRCSGNTCLYHFGLFTIFSQQYVKVYREAAAFSMKSGWSCCLLFCLKGDCQKKKIKEKKLLSKCFVFLLSFSILRGLKYLALVHTAGFRLTLSFSHYLIKTTKNLSGHLTPRWDRFSTSHCTWMRRCWIQRPGEKAQIRAWATVRDDFSFSPISAATDAHVNMRRGSTMKVVFVVIINAMLFFFFSFFFKSVK